MKLLLLRRKVLALSTYEQTRILKAVGVGCNNYNAEKKKKKVILVEELRTTAVVVVQKGGCCSDLKRSSTCNNSNAYRNLAVLLKSISNTQLTKVNKLKSRIPQSNKINDIFVFLKHKKNNFKLNNLQPPLLQISSGNFLKRNNNNNNGLQLIWARHFSTKSEDKLLFFPTVSSLSSGESRATFSSKTREFGLFSVKGSPREFMENHGVKPGDYVNFLLRMTPREEEPNVYRGTPLYTHPKRKIAFGGCLLGQGLSAAVSSVPEGFYINSFHNYFLNAGREGSIDYHVEAVRDGKTYCNRFVNGIQNGKSVIQMQVSLKKEESDQFKHQRTMPECKKPQELQSALNLLKSKIKEDISDGLKQVLQERLPIDPVVEFRPVDPEEMYRLKPLPPKRLTWVKITEKLDNDENLHRCAMAYLSDYLLITTTLLPNENCTQKFYMTSLDHSIWFHNKVRMDTCWLLYETESSHAGEGLGFSTGRFWAEDGTLVASVAQQGVIRSLI